MKVLNYNGKTGEFLSETDAISNPREPGKFLLRGNAVFKDINPLPVIDVNETAIWDFVNDWVVTPDFRQDGEWYNINTGEIKEFLLGEAPDATISKTFPEAVQAQLDEQQRIDEIKTAGLGLINLIFPAINTLDEIDFYAEFWLSIDPASRTPTLNFQKIIDVRQIAKDAIINKTPSGDVTWP